MKNINLKKLYGKKYKIRIDKKQMYEDRAIEQEKIQTGEEWYQNIICKYGEIYLNGGTELTWYSTSKNVAMRMEREHPEIITNFSQCDEEAIVCFDINDIETVFKFAHPRRKRRCHLSPEQIAKFAEGGKSYQFQKK